MRSWIAGVVAAAACTPIDPTPPLVKYDGPVAAALATLAKDCTAFGLDAGKPVDQSRDFRCTGPGAELRIHLDDKRRLRAAEIKLVAATTDEARAKLDLVLTPILDAHHRTNTLSHLDEEAPGGVTPIPQLELEGYLYQIANEAIPDDAAHRRYVYNVRIN